MVVCNHQSRKPMSKRTLLEGMLTTSHFTKPHSSFKDQEAKRRESYTLSSCNVWHPWFLPVVHNTSLLQEGAWGESCSWEVVGKLLLPLENFFLPGKARENFKIRLFFYLSLILKILQNFVLQIDSSFLSGGSLFHPAEASLDAPSSRS